MTFVILLSYITKLYYHYQIKYFFLIKNKKKLNIYYIKNIYIYKIRKRKK